MWCNTYNNDPEKCKNAFVVRNSGELGRCESSGSECFVSEASTGCYNPQHDLGNMDYMDNTAIYSMALTTFAGVLARMAYGGIRP